MADVRVGFMGLGIMGSRMAANLARAGYELTVWTHTPGKAEQWACEHGAQVASSPADLGARSDFIVTMVVDGAQVRELLLGDEGAARGAAPGTLCIDMSTIAPADVLEIGARLAERSLAMIDAPVTGSSPRAADGSLTIMAGGEQGDFERALALFEVMGEVIVHVGPLGKGQAVKLINNALAAANAAALAEALVLAQAEQLDTDGAARGARRRLRCLDDAFTEGASDARARLHDALQDRPHGQGRTALPAGGSSRRGPVPGRRTRAGAARSGRRRRPGRGGLRSDRRTRGQARPLTLLGCWLAGQPNPRSRVEKSCKARQFGHLDREAYV